MWRRHDETSPDIVEKYKWKSGEKLTISTCVKCYHTAIQRGPYCDFNTSDKSRTPETELPTVPEYFGFRSEEARIIANKNILSSWSSLTVFALSSSLIRSNMGFNPVLLGGVVALGLGNMFHIIGLATPEWIKVGKVTVGLFEGCLDDDCVTIEDKPDWLKACQAMAILGMLLGLMAVALATFMFVKSLKNNDSPKSLGLLTLLAAILSLIFILICVILYAVEIKDLHTGPDFGYSFALSIVGAILILLGGTLSLGGSR
ncbi:hypothetical protein RRG08_015281 [Elysia crispata]|uniref:Uncharacterized protein n=1 Tax=Elysia crispata TaxID=231223 RepID=A0AAE0ZTN9_9GAST|nr:hypothetical protein RRG08_015281 [Elysia crispata]